MLQNVLDAADPASGNLCWDDVMDFVDVLVKQNLGKNTAKDTPGTRGEREAAMNLLDLLVTLSIRSM